MPVHRSCAYRPQEGPQSAANAANPLSCQVVTVRKANESHHHTHRNRNLEAAEGDTVDTCGDDEAATCFQAFNCTDGHDGARPVVFLQIPSVHTDQYAS